MVIPCTICRSRWNSTRHWSGFSKSKDHLFPYYRDMLTAISAGVSAEEIILGTVSPKQPIWPVAAVTCRTILLNLNGTSTMFHRLQEIIRFMQWVWQGQLRNTELRRWLLVLRANPLLRKVTFMRPSTVLPMRVTGCLCFSGQQLRYFGA